MTCRYSEHDLVIIIPTKDRPGKVKDLLDSISRQSVICGRIIIVASGQDIGSIVDIYKNILPVEYHRSPVQGQIYQRNHGISLLDENTRLVCSLDDDIVLEEGAIASMIAFWNHCEPDTAGVSFNIINAPPFKHTMLKAFIGMSAPKKGQVLASGYNLAASPADRDIRTQWLCGGATVWKKEILKKYINQEVPSRWAICEDVIFSYPIGKEYPLYVCSDAKVRHEHVYDHQAKMKYWYYGRTITLWRLYFVESHPELSKISYFWMIWWQILIRLSMGVFLLRPREIQYACGQLQGVVNGLTALVTGKKLLLLLHDEW